MVNLEEVKNLIKNISTFRIREEEKMSTLDLSLSNEIQSSSFYDATYKVVPLCKHSYSHYHYDTNNRYYDVFIYENEYINEELMLQLILCDNYAEILAFPKYNYSAKKYVSRFSLVDAVIHTFYDGSIIVVETRDGRAEFPYESIWRTGLSKLSLVLIFNDWYDFNQYNIQ